MAITHVAATRNNFAAQVLTNVGNSGVLSFEVSGGATVVAALSLPTTSGTVAAAVLTFGVFTDDTNATAGTVAEFAIQTSANADVFRGNVQTSGGDINMSSLVVGSGDTVSCSSLVYTASL